MLLNLGIVGFVVSLDVAMSVSEVKHLMKSLDLRWLTVSAKVEVPRRLLHDICAEYLDQNEKLREAYVTIGQYRHAEMEQEYAKERRRMKTVPKTTTGDKAMKATKAMKTSKTCKRAMKA